jgi:hypothetical protein
MKHKGFYIVGGVLVAVGAVLYFTKSKPTIIKKEEQIVTGGQSATIPPMEAPSLSTPPLINEIEDTWLKIKGLIIKK